MHSAHAERAMQVLSEFPPNMPATVCLEGHDGNFYGFTRIVAPSGDFSSIIRIGRQGLTNNVFKFGGTNGSAVTDLIQADDGNLYGATASGGDNFSGQYSSGYGTVFRLSTNGAHTVLHAFSPIDGTKPSGHLAFGPDGHIYGTTWEGGEFGMGTIYQVTTNGDFTRLFSFAGTNGAEARSGLITGSDGHLYGATYSGGS